MCGIFGYLNTNKIDLEVEKVKRMGLRIQHRGPDDQGIFWGQGVALGNQRLSIIDISGGHQPFISDDTNIVVVQNGEIFNYTELAAELKGTRYECRTHSDTEVLLRLYEKEGIDFIHKLNGMFAIGIYDKRINRVYVVRDRIGVKPMYYQQQKDNFYFSSEIKSILEVNGFFQLSSAEKNQQINISAVHHFLSFNYVPQPITIFKDVFHVKPGHYLEINSETKKILQHQWWTITTQKKEERKDSDWCEQISSTLSDAVRIRLRADVPFGAFLSGGIDSSAVVGYMSQHLGQPVKTYSIGFEDQRFDESRFAKMASDRFKTQHVNKFVDMDMLPLWPKVIYHCDQPHGDISFIPTLKVSELAVKDVKMVLTGDGGDELFAGYEKYVDFFTAKKPDVNCSTFIEDYFNFTSLMTEGTKQLLYKKGSKEFAGLESSYSFLNQHVDTAEHWDPINRILNVDMQFLLSGNNLVKPDRMGMAVSLEARTPFLDYRMMELAFRIPGRLKLKNSETKAILKTAVSPLIGQELAYRKKQMFTVPVGEWFKDRLFDYCKNMLLAESSFCSQYFNVGFIETMINQHARSEKNYTREIRALLAIELWKNSFIDSV
jgi:asparagine synthase (glutamine-hydrolysing)